MQPPSTSAPQALQNAGSAGPGAVNGMAAPSTRKESKLDTLLMTALEERGSDLPQGVAKEGVNVQNEGQGEPVQETRGDAHCAREGQMLPQHQSGHVRLQQQHQVVVVGEGGQHGVQGQTAQARMPLVSAGTAQGAINVSRREDDGSQTTHVAPGDNKYSNTDRSSNDLLANDFQGPLS